jgi:hypothetical protein
MQAGCTTAGIPAWTDHVTLVCVDAPSSGQIDASTVEFGPALAQWAPDGSHRR